MILDSKIAKTFCLSLILFALPGCYSDFLVNIKEDQKFPIGNDISKIIMNDGSTISIDDNCKIELAGPDSIQIIDQFHNKKTITINDINGFYLHRFDDRKTFYTIFFGGAAVFFILHGLGIIHWPAAS